MGRVGGEQIIGFHGRPYDGDPHTTSMPGARIEIVEPMREVKLWADPDGEIGLDLTWRARTQPYGLRRGTMRAGDDIVWDQCHIFQSGTYEGTYTARGKTVTVDGWVGQRDHSWGIRDHGRCPLWIWWQIQLEDGFIGVWHWELPNGARVYTDGCWAPNDMSDPVPITDFHYDASWTGTYGKHGEDVTGLKASCTFTLEDGRTIEIRTDFVPFTSGSADTGGNAELVERLDDRRDRAEHGAGARQFLEVVRSEARLGAVRVAEVGAADLPELLELGLRDDRLDERRRVGRPRCCWTDADALLAGFHEADGQEVADPSV
jgi:hypothetical protein